MASLLLSDSYNPVALLDEVMLLLKVRSDASLARRLNISPPVICRIRKREVLISAGLLIHMHDATGISLDVLRDLGGIPKTKFYPHAEDETC